MDYDELQKHLYHKVKINNEQTISNHIKKLKSISNGIINNGILTIIRASGI